MSSYYTNQDSYHHGEVEAQSCQLFVLLKRRQNSGFLLIHPSARPGWPAPHSHQRGPASPSAHEGRPLAPHPPAPCVSSLGASALEDVISSSFKVIVCPPPPPAPRKEHSMWQGPGPSVHSWHTVGTQSVHRKTEGADGCAVARRCPFPPGAPPSGRAGRGGRQGCRIETSRMWTAKPSLFAQRVYPFTVERAEDRRRRKRSVRLLGRRARARPPGAWGGRRDLPGTCPAWGAPCPALSLQSPQADVIPPPRKDPTHTEPRAGLPRPVPRPCWKPLEGSSQNAGRPSQLTPPCPPAFHHSSAESGPGALGCIKLQAFIECWLFAQLHTGHHGGFRSIQGMALGASKAWLALGLLRARPRAV